MDAIPPTYRLCRLRLGHLIMGVFGSMCRCTDIGGESCVFVAACFKAHCWTLMFSYKSQMQSHGRQTLLGHDLNRMLSRPARLPFPPLTRIQPKRQCYECAFVQ